MMNGAPSGSALLFALELELMVVAEGFQGKYEVFRQWFAVGEAGFGSDPLAGGELSEFFFDVFDSMEADAWGGDFFIGFVAVGANEEGVLPLAVLRPGVEFPAFHGFEEGLGG